MFDPANPTLTVIVRANCGHIQQASCKKVDVPDPLHRRAHDHAKVLHVDIGRQRHDFRQSLNISPSQHVGRHYLPLETFGSRASRLARTMSTQ